MQQNSLLGLPVEFWLEVYNEAAKNDKPDEGAKTIFRLASVCQRWRDILLDYGPVWAALSLANLQATRLMLERSKNVPLVIRADLAGFGPYQQHSSNARYVLEHVFERVQKLAVLADHYELYPARIFDVFSGMAATSLTTLELTSPGSANRPVFKIKLAHLSGTMALRDLTLHDTAFVDGAADLLINHYSSLVHLDLREVRGLTLSNLLAALGAAQNSLKTFEIDSLEFATAPNPHVTAPLNSSALEVLTLHGLTTFMTSRTQTAVLQYIIYPASTHFIAEVHVNIGNAHVLEGPSPLGLHLASRDYKFWSALVSPLDADELPSSGQMGLQLRCWTSRPAPDIYNLDQRPPASLDLRVVYPKTGKVHHAAAVLASLSKAANLASVCRAAVAPFEHDVPWARVLVPASHLDELRVHGPVNLDNLLQACTVSADQVVNENTLYTHAELYPLSAPFPRASYCVQRLCSQARGYGFLQRHVHAEGTPYGSFTPVEGALHRLLQHAR